ncbi:MAG: hypothetical protein ABSF53_20990 [Terracidiphilus sp.]|jgi:hypothetical protein
MKPVLPNRVVEVERLGGGIFIQFSNGEAALYSAALLHSIIGQAFVLQGVTSASRADGQSSPKPVGKAN